MLEAAALTYGMLATFVLGAAGRNRREARDNPPQVQLMGWMLLSFSGASGMGLIGYAGVQALG